MSGEARDLATALAKARRARDSSKLSGNDDRGTHPPHVKQSRPKPSSKVGQSNGRTRIKKTTVAHTPAKSSSSSSAPPKKKKAGPASKSTTEGVQAMVQGVLSQKNRKPRNKSRKGGSNGTSEESFIDLKSDIKIRMAPFLMDEEGNFTGDSPTDEAARERKLQRQRRYEQLRREFSQEDPPPPPASSSSSPSRNPPPQPLPPNSLQGQEGEADEEGGDKLGESLYGDLDWDREEEELNKQAEATKKEMAKLQRKRNQLKFAKKQEELKRSFTKQLQTAKQQTERELQSRISAMRVERKERVGKVESFKTELKERIDALCRCYEEVSVRGVALSNSFKEAEDRMIAEARNVVQMEKESLEAQLRAHLVELANKLNIDGV